MRSRTLSTYTQLGLICGGSASTISAVMDQQPAPMVLLAAAIGAAIGAAVGALYGYVKQRRDAR